MQTVTTATSAWVREELGRSSSRSRTERLLLAGSLRRTLRNVGAEGSRVKRKGNSSLFCGNRVGLPLPRLDVQRKDELLEHAIDADFPCGPQTNSSVTGPTFFFSCGKLCTIRKASPQLLFLLLFLQGAALFLWGSRNFYRDGWVPSRDPLPAKAPPKVFFPVFVLPLHLHVSFPACSSRIQWG